MIGIYKITSPSGKVYIGQSKALEKRKAEYIRLECKGQPRLYNSIIKYGFTAHTYEIVEECLFEELNIRERYWQDFYDVIGENGLNCILTAADEKPKTYSQETRDRISTARLELLKTPEGLEMLNKQAQSRRNFEATQEGIASRNAITANLIAFNQTKEGLLKVQNQAVKLKAFYQTEEGIESKAKQVLNTNYHIIAEKNRKAINQYDKAGTLIKEWTSGKEASTTLGICRGDISSCLKERYKSAGGFIWRYEEKELEN
jgi:group I intron endonuclease